MVTKKITLDRLTKDSVSVKTEYLQEIEGKYERLGYPHRKAYVNSLRGRQEVENELEDVFKNAIFSVWGDTPTVDETVAD